MWPFKKTSTQNSVNAASAVISESLQETEKTKDNYQPASSYTFPVRSFFRRDSGSKVSNPAPPSRGVVVTSPKRNNDLKDIGLDRLDFTLIECCDWVGPAPICRRCGTGFLDYFIHTTRGETWHSKCFSTFVCPNFTESAEGQQSSIKVPVHNLNEAQIALTDQSSTSDMNSTEISSDIISNNQVKEFSKNSELGDDRDIFIQTEDNTSIKSSSLHSYAAADEDRGSVVSEAEKFDVGGATTGRALSWAIQLEYMTRANNDLISTKGQTVETPHSSEAEGTDTLNSSDIASSIDCADNEKNVIVAELNDLGKFRYRNITSRSSVDAAATLEIERELEVWSKKVDLALDRSIRLFPPELFTSTESFDGSRDGLNITFTSHSSVIMHAIRLRFGITAPEFAKSFSLGELAGGDKGEGKSGNFMWSTCDSRFVLKTISREEFNFLNKLLPSYYEHMIIHGTHTLLCRFMGLYTIKVATEHPITVVIMNNVFYHPPNPLFRAAHVHMDEVFDLKGSAISRLVSNHGKILVTFSFLVTFLF